MAERTSPADDGTAGRASSVDPQVDTVIDLRGQRVIDLRQERPHPPGDVRRRRQQLVRYLGPSSFPASRRDLVDAVRRSQAPDHVVELMVRLPHGRYDCEDDVLAALGLERRAVRR